jgi:MinD-like ATPase involved in chromosome partitioning or flagellar assembly/CheY-like chemotaxis protein
MPAKILLIDSDAATLNWLKVKLEQENFSVATARSGNEGLAQIEQDQPDIIVLDIALADMDGLEVLRRVGADPRGTPPWMIVFSKKYQPQDIAAGFQAGANDFIGKRPGADVELIGKIRGHLAQMHARKPAPPPPPPPVNGHIFSFCSSKGGSGVTSVCVNVAYALAQVQPEARILVVDMVFPFGTIASALAFDSRRTVARMTHEPAEEIERATVEKYISAPLKWGFRLLIGTSDPQEAGNLDATRIEPIFKTLRTMYDYILVDFGRTLSRISLPIIEISERVLFIVSPDITTVKGAKLMLNYLRSRDIAFERIFLINNRTVGRVWTTAEDIERELGLKVNAMIPYEVEYMTMATNDGVPFMAKFPEHAASAMFRQVAQKLREHVQGVSK